MTNLCTSVTSIRGLAERRVTDDIYIVVAFWKLESVKHESCFMRSLGENTDIWTSHTPEKKLVSVYVLYTGITKTMYMY